MASGNTFSRIHPIDFGGTDVGEIQALALSDGIQIQRLGADGHVDAAATQVMAYSPSLSFDTIDLDGALSVGGFDGADVASVVAYNALIGTGGAKAAGASHEKWTYANCFVYPMSLTWSQGSNASVSMMALGFSGDGSNPLTRAASQTLSSPTIDYDERWALKDIVINGTTITEVASASIDFGISPRAQQFDGDVSPKGYTIISRPATMSFTTVNTDQVLAATAISSTVVFRFRKWNNIGSFVDDATSEHITVTANAGLVVPQGVGGDPQIGTFTVTADRQSGGGDALTLGLGVTL